MTTHPPIFSKSQLMSCVQCRKKLWLELQRTDCTATEVDFGPGHAVGDIARQIYDPKGRGVAIGVANLGTTRAILHTKELLPHRKVIFEAGFAAKGALAFADVLLPVLRNGEPKWRIVAVKASTEVKSHHHDDAAIQAYVARKSGLPLAAIAIAYVDRDWVYPGSGNYKGLLLEEDLTHRAFARSKEVEEWIATALQTAAKRKEPSISTGDYCSRPFECGFMDYCAAQEPKSKHPAIWLPNIRSKELRNLIYESGVREMRRLPNALLNALQQRVKIHTMENRVYFDPASAARALAPHGFPAFFIDFETINFCVPIWKGTRPYQKLPFQFSLHRLSKTGSLEHASFLDLSGNDPSNAFAESLLTACGDNGPVYVYNARFEGSILTSLADRFPKLKRSLMAIVARMVDLLPIAEANYYHPSQKGSWSIKAVLPTIAPDLNYAALDGVQDGTMAMQAFAEAIDPKTPNDRRDAIRHRLLEYCKLDTIAMVRLWHHFAGRKDVTF